MNRLENKVALIVGGGAGLGRNIALAFAKEGADVSIADIYFERAENTAREIQQANRRSLPVQADITKISDIDKLVKTTYEYFHRIDILVNSAGIFLQLSVMDIREQDWDSIMNLHLKGVFFTIQRVIPIMVKQGKGKIINFTSALGVRGKKDDCAYCAAKAGVINMTRALAVELGPQNILVNALAPGLMINPQNGHIQPDSELAKEILKKVPLGRLGRPEDITSATIYLASDESDFTTGTTLFADGGETA